MTIQSSRMLSADYPLSSPRKRGPSIPECLLQFRDTLLRRRLLGPRFRGDDNWRGLALSLMLALLPFLVVTAALAAPLPSQLGPEVAITRPRDGYVGRLDVAPEHGAAGTEVTVSARELPPNAEL